MKVNHNPGWKLRAQAERRVIAETRNAEYAKLSPQAKLKLLDSAKLNAGRQRAKLLAQITKP